MRARMVFVPWRESFAGREDTGLSDVLKAEGSAILRWAIEGAVAWQRDGLGIPAEISAASDDYLESEDALGQFLADHTVADKRARVSTVVLHRAFRYWQQERGEHEWSQTAFGIALQERGYRAFRARLDGGLMRGFEGLRLREEPGELADLL
jgi:putative DNA primase/helicase